RNWFQRAELLESQYLDWDNLEPHIPFMQDSADMIDFPDLYQRLSGRYYGEASTVFYFNVSTNGHQLYVNGPRQQKYPYYPVGSRKFRTTMGHQARFEMDEAGNPIAVNGLEPGGRAYRLSYIHSALDAARESLIEFDYASAQTQFAEVPEAYQKGWLYEAVQNAIIFDADEVAMDWDSFVGEFRDDKESGVEIFNENGRLYAVLLGNRNLDRFPIFQINESDFVNMNYLGRTLRMIRQGERLVAIEIMYPDKESLKFNRVPS
ncbi:MAG: hypothetical protein AB8H47_03535, partial [Bacteroidia bacterium]